MAVVFASTWLDARVNCGRLLFEAVARRACVAGCSPPCGRETAVACAAGARQPRPLPLRGRRRGRAGRHGGAAPLRPPCGRALAVSAISRASCCRRPAHHPHVAWTAGSALPPHQERCSAAAPSSPGVVPPSAGFLPPVQRPRWRVARRGVDAAPMAKRRCWGGARVPRRTPTPPRLRPRAAVGGQAAGGGGCCLGDTTGGGCHRRERHRHHRNHRLPKWVAPKPPLDPATTPRARTTLSFKVRPLPLYLISGDYRLPHRARKGTLQPAGRRRT